jgi:hypothetical protein
MGSFSGHLLPGLFFIIFGLRWTYSVFSEYYILLVKRKRLIASSDHMMDTKTSSAAIIGFRCRLFFPLFSSPALEAWFTVISCTIGVIAEFVTAFKNGKFTHLGNVQHMVMYTAFGIWGVSFLMSRRSHDDSRQSTSGPRISRQLHREKPCQFLPEGVEYMTLMISLSVEAVLFFYHLHGRTPLDVHVHQLLILTVLVCLLSVCVESFKRDNVLFSAFRAFASLLQGTWFIQVR